MKNNLINSNQDKLAIILSDYLKKANAQMPIMKEIGQEVPLPIKTVMK